ncbi:MAG: sel1 repeat family protein [Stappiaceae bacterium]
MVRSIQLLALLFAGIFATASVSASEDDDSGGTLNPEEMSIGRVMDNVRGGRLDMMTCASGYFITKAGRHVPARELFEACAEAGYTGAMTWMSQMDNNGLGAPENPDAAADWDKRAADAGDPIGKFNHGINLIRGHGISQNKALGQKYIDEAAKAGLTDANRLKGADYDLDEVTPDSDNWKYAPMF